MLIRKHFWVLCGQWQEHFSSSQPAYKRQEDSEYKSLEGTQALLLLLFLHEYTSNYNESLYYIYIYTYIIYIYIYSPPMDYGRIRQEKWEGQEREGHWGTCSNSERIGCSKWQSITILNILSKSNLLCSCHRPDICTLLGKAALYFKKPASQASWAFIYP